VEQKRIEAEEVVNAISLDRATVRERLTPIYVADGVAFRYPDEQSTRRGGPAVFLGGPREHP
jgi:hypothetical protein